MRYRKPATILAALLIAGGIAFALWYNALPQRMDREFDDAYSRMGPPSFAPHEQQKIQVEVDRLCEREGTNAIPTLLVWIEEAGNKPPRLRNMLDGVLSQFSTAYRDRHVDRVYKRTLKGFAAARALRFYGRSKASWVLPRLRAMDRESSGIPKLAVMLAAESIGEDLEAFVASVRSSGPRTGNSNSD